MGETALRDQLERITMETNLQIEAANAAAELAGVEGHVEPIAENPKNPLVSPEIFAQTLGQKQSEVAELGAKEIQARMAGLLGGMNFAALGIAAAEHVGGEAYFSPLMRSGLAEEVVKPYKSPLLRGSALV